MTTQHEPTRHRPGYMRWFFPVLLGFFLTLGLAFLASWLLDLWPTAARGRAEEDGLLMAEAHREADLRRELALLEEHYAAMLMDCRVAALEEEREALEEIPEDIPEELPEETVDETLPEDEDLVIPEDAPETGDMEFLMGCWLSETGLVNMDTGEPVTVQYCFDENGEGIREIQDVRGACSGLAHATMGADGVLRIQADPSPCDFGAVSYIDSLVTCRTGQDRKAVCHGEEGGDTWDAHFTRIR